MAQRPTLEITGLKSRPISTSIMSFHLKNRRGFTIVELLIVIVVIAILATIVIVAYNGIQERARTTVILSNMNQVSQLIEQYNAVNGYYPITNATTLQGGTTSSTTLTDSGCSVGTSTLAWVPDLTQTLPQSDHNSGAGVNTLGGCYMYQSDGKSYVLSAWNMLKSPQSSLMYRRIGFREMSNTPFYYCNQVNIGGNNPTPYTMTKDYYKYSYTITNIGFCNESPPSGA
jgi:prepilin-type N-terminal cleavage/methylation domain-containing protein